MKKQIFTLLTLLVLCVTGAWADTYVLSAETATEYQEEGKPKTFVSNGQTFTIAKGSTPGVAGEVSSLLLKLSKNATYTIGLPTGFTITAINFKGYTNKSDKTCAIDKVNNNDTGWEAFPNNGVASTQASWGNHTYNITGTAQTASTVTFRVANVEQINVVITITGTPAPVSAGTPVFSPATGSSVAEGSKITITSTNSTSIKYKWTADDTTPSSGWSDYDADAKVTVPASSDGTPYLHAQGFKDDTPGTAGYAQYTITAPDTEAPTFSSATPANGATDVAVNAELTATYNENIVIDDSKITLVKTSDDSAVEFTASASGAVLTVTPNAALAYNTGYTLTIGAGAVADGSSNATTAATVIAFTTVQETVATPVITVYGNKVVNITCTTDGATIYYEMDNASIKSSGSKLTYSANFIPAANGTVYAYATKTGAIDSEVASATITLPDVGDVEGNLLMTLQPSTVPASDTAYGSNTFTKGGYTLASDKTLNNSFLEGYPCNFKGNVKTATITVTPPANVTIQSIKIYGISNDNSKLTDVIAGTGGTIISTPSKLMPRNVKIGSDGVMSEVVMTIDSPTEAAPVSFKLGDEVSQARFYVEVYGTTSATSETVTIPAGKTYITYVPNHDLNFTGHAKLTAYIATAANATAVTMNSVDKVPAGTPIVLKATETGDIDVPVAASTDDVSANKLVIGDGATKIGGAGKYDYILKNGLFCKVTTASALAAGKCYLHLDAAPVGANELTFDFGDVTGIADVKGKVEEAKGEFYNLAGQRVAQPTKGLYIVNGKKVVLK